MIMTTRIAGLFGVAIAATLAAATSTAGAAVDPTGLQVQPASRGGPAPILAQQSTPCIGGYRTIHIVRGQGRTGPGVIVRCRG